MSETPSTPDLDIEGDGQSSGVPADGRADTGANEPLGSSGLRHWRKSTITEPGLNDRGNVFFAAIEMTRMPMILTDPSQDDNPIAFANKAFLDLTGYEDAEILGRNCRFLQGAQTDRAQVAELRRAIEARESVALEILNYKRDGTPFWNAVFIGPVFDVHGKLLYFFASQLDVTRRRDTEQSFRQAQKMEAIGQLTAGLAHDFNNLLQVVNGNLEILAARTDDQRSQRYLTNARAAAERGAKLTGQLLAFARKTRLEPRPIDINARINELDDLITSTVGRQITVKLDLSETLPPALVDPDQLEMAVINIVVNARDAMPSGGTVTIATTTTHIQGDMLATEITPGDYVELSIADQGAGMSPQVIQRATEPFFTTKATGKGTGLGLAMASGFVQQSRGRLDIDSTVGEGTVVRMLFPAARAAAETIAEEDQRRGGEAPDDAPSEHILVVEDSSEVLELAREILSEVGYRVETAVNGEEGLATFRRMMDTDPFNLVFTDLVMPGGMNGILLAEEIAKIDPRVGILMTTGYNEELVVEGPPRPGLDVLGKPYRRSELLDRVRQALNQRGEVVERRRPSDFGTVEE